RRSAVIGGIRATAVGGHASGWHRWIVRGILRTARKAAPTCAVPGGRHADPAGATRAERGHRGPGARPTGPARTSQPRRASLRPDARFDVMCTSMYSARMRNRWFTYAKSALE